MQELRYRGTQEVNAATTDEPSSKQKQTKEDHKGKLYGTLHLLGICCVTATLAYIVYYSGEYLPPSKPIDAPATEFSGERARTYLVGITNFGARPAGSYANDVQAVQYLLHELNKIKEKANPQFHIEIELQKASGSFAFFRKSTKFVDSYGTTSTYDNTSNVVVRVSPRESTENYVLINAHYDTVPNTEGASDDTVNCAVMIESFQALINSDPAKLKHGVVFLFNGAEEGGLSGSHAFLQHRWFPSVKVVVNVEAAGSGGREFVFQTGPGHPWILGMYASTAKYPSCSVLAQEIFHAGIIPSDTDFRIFVQYGNLVGVDMAFVKNGYVYHTKYDDAKSIPSGSIQRAGDNIYGLVKGIASSEYLSNPERYKHGSSIFFDFLGVFVIHYPKRLHLLMNWITCAVIALYITQNIVRQRLSSNRENIHIKYVNNSAVSLSSLILSTITILFSWVLAFVFPISIAYILIRFEVMMTWYSYPKFALLLYGVPALFGMIFSHYISVKITDKLNVQSFLNSHLLIFTTILYFANRSEVSSSFIVWFWIIFPFFLLCTNLENIFFTDKEFATYFLHIMAFAAPVTITMYNVDLLYMFFGPILGRTGDKLPSDIVMASLSAFSVVMMFTFIMGLSRNAANMKKLLCFVGLLSLLPCFYVSMGRLKPYSAHNPITPKRLYMSHILRKFHNADGSIERSDSGIWVQPVDALGFRPLKHIEHFKDAEDFKCDGSYCGLPYYYAKRIMLAKQWYLRGEQPEGIIEHSLSPNIYERVQLNDGSVRFNFNIKGADHMVLFLTLKDGVELDWSMYKTRDNHIFKMNDYNGGFAYIVFYTHGYVYSSWKFWLEFKRSSSSTSSSAFAQLGLAQHHLHGKKSRTRFLNKTIHALPDWVYSNSWCSNYDSFMLE